MASETRNICLIRKSGAFSERIAHAEIERRILQPEMLNPTLPGRFVRIVELDAPVETEDEEAEIEARAETGIESELLVEPVDFEPGLFRAALIHEPDVAQIEEQRTLQNAPNRETGLEVGLELEIGQLARIVREVALRVAAGTERASQPRMLLLPPQ